MKKIFTIFLLMFSLAIGLPAMAATEFKEGDTVIIQKGETVKGDLYAAGGMVSIAGNIEGDLLAVGGKIDVSGTIKQDLMLAGGFIDVVANVMDDVRISGGFLTINGPVSGDVIATGGFITIGQDAKIGGDLIVAGGVVIINGHVVGNTRIEGGKVIVNGILNGPAVIIVEETLTVGDSAIIKNGLQYRASKEADIAQGAKIQGLKFDENLRKIKSNKTAWAKKDKKLGGMFTGFIMIIWLAKLIVILLGALVMASLFKKAFKAIVEATIKNGDTFGRSLLIGFMLVVFVPILVLVLLITFFLSYIGAVLGVVLVAILCISKVATGIVLGSLIFRWFDEKKQLKVTNWSVVVGTLVGAIIALIPIIGWIFLLVFWGATTGGIATLVYKNYWLNR